MYILFRTEKVLKFQIRGLDVFMLSISYYTHEHVYKFWNLFLFPISVKCSLRYPEGELIFCAWQGLSPLGECTVRLEMALGLFSLFMSELAWSGYSMTGCQNTAATLPWRQRASIIHINSSSFYFPNGRPESNSEIGAIVWDAAQAMLPSVCTQG